MSERQMIRVVFDSTSFWGDWHLGSRHWETLQVLVEHGLLEAYVPEVVVQEVIRAYKRETNDFLGELKRLGLWKLNALLGLQVPGKIDALKPGVDELIDNFEDAFREDIDTFGLKVVSLPVVETQSLLARALECRKPFDGEGKNGYRDALVWHSLLDVCRSPGQVQQIILVTNNTGDFCDRASGELSPLLRAEALEAGSAEVRVIRTLSAVIDYLEREKKFFVDDGPQWLPIKEPDGDLIVEAVSEACNRLVGNETGFADLGGNSIAEVDFSGFRTIIEGDATLREIQPDVSALTWFCGQRDSEGQPVAEAAVNAQILLEGMAFKADYYSENDPDIEVYDADWNNHYMWIGTYRDARLTFTILLTSDSASVQSVELVSAESLTEARPVAMELPDGVDE